MSDDDLHQNINKFLTTLSKEQNLEMNLFRGQIQFWRKINGKPFSSLMIRRQLGMAALKGGPREGYLFDEDDFRKWLEEFLSKESEG